jgi:transposase-like protein
MSQKTSRRKFSEETKRKAVHEYISGAKSAIEVANKLSIAVGLLYRWKAEFEQAERYQKIEDLTAAGATRAMAIKIQQQEEEIAAYQKKVAELTLINDLLKKLRTSKNSPPESELSGWIGIAKRSVQKPKPVVS